jgi:phage baseplate assembly protein W
MLLIELKFGPADESVRRRVREADADALLRWSERVGGADRTAKRRAAGESSRVS